MEPGTATQLSPRGRRAVALIAVSLLTIAVAGLAWVGPGLHLAIPANPIITAGNPVPPAPLRPTVYSFVIWSAGWADVGGLGDESTVFKTEDGGRHWRRQITLVGAWTGSIQFLDLTHGFVVTSNPGRLYRTIDGGAHWKPIAVSQGDTIEITFADPQHGWLLVSQADRSQLPAIFGTADGGDSWTPLSKAPKDSYGPILRGSEVWLSARGNEAGPLRVYVSVDGGVSWSSREVPRPPGSNPDASALSPFWAKVRALPGGGVAVLAHSGTELAQFVSFDGSTWKYVARPPGEYLGIGYGNGSQWWSAGASGSLFESSDAGRTWVQTPSQLPPGLTTFYVLDSQDAWVQVVSTLLFTGDGGLHWSKVSTPSMS